MSEEVRQTEKSSTQLERHLQTLIVLILVALLVWVGTTVQDTQVAVAKLTVEVQFLKSRVDEPGKKFAEIEKRLDGIEKTLNKHTSQSDDRHQ